MSKPMSSNRSYLLKALHQWIIDNQLTPYMVVDAGVEGVSVPNGYAENGRVVLNLSPSAALNLNISNDAVKFSASFEGMPSIVSVPMTAVLAIYAKENGQGMVFPDEDEALSAEPADEDADDQQLCGTNPESPIKNQDDSDDDDDKGGPGGGRGHLKIVK